MAAKGNFLSDDYSQRSSKSAKGFQNICVKKLQEGNKNRLLQKKSKLFCMRNLQKSRHIYILEIDILMCEALMEELPRSTKSCP